MLFNAFISDLDSAIKCALSTFADATKLGGAVSVLRGGETLRGDLDRLESWAASDYMIFNKSKCQVLHLGQVMLVVPTHWEQNSPMERDPGVWFGKN